MLEQQMQPLKDLPDRIGRVESQILQLRTEVKDGFSAIRSDLRAELHGVEAGLRTELHETRDVLRTQVLGIRDTLRVELHEVRDVLRSEMHGIRDEMHGIREELREDIRIGVEESQNLAKGLHAEAMHAISNVDTAIRRDVVGRLDRLLELRRPDAGGQ